MKVQRLRVTFCRGEEVRYITHLDLMRVWERVLRRAEMPLAYSQGYSPSPRISLAAPLPVGVTSSGELMDVYLSRRITPYHFIKVVSQQLPEGIAVREVQEVGLGLPSLQSQVRWSEYQVDVPSDRPREDVEKAVARLLAAESLPWQHQRDKEVRRYDLRPLVHDLWLDGLADGLCTLGMRLRTDSQGSGRAEQVAAALGFNEPPLRIHRRKLILEETSPAVEAWRRHGQPG
jgi:radical SAM-linked protein